MMATKTDRAARDKALSEKAERARKSEATAINELLTDYDLEDPLKGLEGLREQVRDLELVLGGYTHAPATETVDRAAALVKALLACDLGLREQVEALAKAHVDARAERAADKKALHTQMRDAEERLDEVLKYIDGDEEVVTEASRKLAYDAAWAARGHVRTADPGEDL